MNLLRKQQELETLLIKSKTMNKEELVIQKIATLITGSKFEGRCFVAGGYVRDKIMCKQSKDIDIVVELPNGGIEFANFIAKKTGTFKAGSNPVVFERFGTAKICVDGLDVESVMTRNEVYNGNSRNPEVISGTIMDDVLRRDFTINSLLMNVNTNEILDLTGKGIADIRDLVLRTTSDPILIFNEDPLRMLRAIRFAVKLNATFADGVFEAIIKNAHKMGSISMERRRDEFVKILISPNPVRGIMLLLDSGLMKFLVAPVSEMINCTQNDKHKWDVFDHTMNVIANVQPKPLVRLAALFHDIAKPRVKTVDDNGKVSFLRHEEVGAVMVKEILKDLKFTNDEISIVSDIVANHMRIKQAGDDGSKLSDKALRKFKFECSLFMEDLLDLMHADNISHADDANMPNQIAGVTDRLNKLEDIPVAQHIKLPINGDDIIKLLGIKPGKDVGDLLKIVEEAFMEDPKLSKSQCLDLLNFRREDTGIIQ
jgi:poly(A) polymerase